MLYKLLIFFIIIQCGTIHMLDNYFQCETTNILDIIWKVYQDL